MLCLNIWTRMSIFLRFIFYVFFLIFPRNTWLAPTRNVFGCNEMYFQVTPYDSIVFNYFFFSHNNLKRCRVHMTKIQKNSHEEGICNLRGNHFCVSKLKQIQNTCWCIACTNACLSTGQRCTCLLPAGIIRCHTEAWIHWVLFPSTGEWLRNCIVELPGVRFPFLIF